MIRKGSLVRYTGHSKTIPDGKLLSVHDAKDGTVTVWLLTPTKKWSKKTIKATDVEEVVE